MAWYTLDSQDNDPARFAAYLLNALGEVLLPQEQLDLQEAVTLILNSVATSGEATILMVDDYHLITTPQIHTAISRLCEYLPPNMRLALGTRADPPLQLARLRTNHDVIEIRMTDLRFTPDEMARWLESSLGWLPSAQMMKELTRLTEGWAAALSLIIMALNRRQFDEQLLESQLAHYSQTQRHIFDYFAQEVLEQQPEEIRQFLLDTCVLNRLHPEVCHPLTDNRVAPLLLNQIAAESLFVIPLSDVEPLYRYHHLFQHFLQHYLKLQDPRRYLAQHHRAAAWYADHDDITVAVDHALAAEDFSYAATLIEETAWETLTSRGEIMTMVNWLPRFPEDTLQKHLRLCLYFSRALYLTGDVARSQDYVRLAIDTLVQVDSSTHESQKLLAIASNYQATLAAYRGDIAEALVWNEKAIALRDTVEGVDQVRIVNTDAFLWYLIGDVTNARRAYEDALDLAQRIEHVYLTLDAHYYLAQIELLAGNLQAVQDRCQTVLATYTAKIGPLCTIMLPLAQVHYQQNRIVEAEATLREAIALAQRANIPDVLWYAHVILADVLLTSGETDQAETCITQARQFARGFRSPMMANFIAAAEARIMLRSGQIEVAVEWAAQYERTQHTSYHQDFENLTLARVWLAQHEPAQALAILTQVIADAQPAERTGNVITAQALQALAHQALGELDVALGILQGALIKARPHRFVRLFLNMGQPMLRLLELAVQRDIVADYAHSLLDIANEIPHWQHPADTLTDREIEVLQQIATGASNQDIADALVISIGTVKSHVHRIMNKLDAQNRTEAVGKARNLNILPE